MNKPQNLAQAVISQVVNKCIAEGAPVIVAQPAHEYVKSQIITLENEVQELELGALALKRVLFHYDADPVNRDYAGTLSSNIHSLICKLEAVQVKLKRQYDLR